MSHTYSAQEALAQRLIREKGASCLIVRRGEAGGDDHNPTPGAVATEACRAVLVQYKSREIDGTLIRAADRKALVSTEGVSAAPTVMDRFRVGVRDFEIVNVSVLSPADVPVMWTLQLRA